MNSLNTGQIEILPDLIKEGMKPSEIAKRYNCNTTTILYWLRKLKKAGYVIPPTPMGRPSRKIKSPSNINN